MIERRLRLLISDLSPTHTHTSNLINQIQLLYALQLTQRHLFEASNRMSLFFKNASLITNQRLVSSLGRSNVHHRSRLCAVHHFFSSSPVAYTSSSNSDANSPVKTVSDNEWQLLYKRSPSRSTYPRATLTFSSFNALYWMWYTFDFTPSVNAAAYEKAALNQIDAESLELLLVDGTIGYVGLGLALRKLLIGFAPDF